MTETLEQIKQTIAEAHEQGIYNWNTATISSLITTIESQNRDITTLNEAHQGWLKRFRDYEEQIKSLKKEKEMSSHNHALYAGELREKIESQKAEIESLQKENERMKDAIGAAHLSLTWSSTENQVPHAVWHLEQVLPQAPESTEQHNEVEAV